MNLVVTFEGMQPTLRHVPPRVAFFSTQTVCRKKKQTSTFVWQTVTSLEFCCHHQILIREYLNPIGDELEHWRRWAYLETKLCSFNCSNITAWTWAHHCDICINCRRETQLLTLQTTMRAVLFYRERSAGYSSTVCNNKWSKRPFGGKKNFPLIAKL